MSILWIPLVYTPPSVEPPGFLTSNTGGFPVDGTPLCRCRHLPEYRSVKVASGRTIFAMDLVQVPISRL